MLFLTSTSDKITLDLSPAATTDVEASFMDSVGSVVTPGRQTTKTVAETSIDIVSPPAGGAARNVKELTLRNRSGGSVTLTVKHTDGTTAVELAKRTLLSSQSMSYVEGQGWRMFDVDGAAL